jgi:hypothetical protein
MMPGAFAKGIGGSGLTLCNGKPSKGGIVGIGTIVAELKKQRDQLSAAIAALDGSSGRLTVVGWKFRSNRADGRQKRHHRLSAAGRKRLSDMMKKRWATGAWKARGKKAFKRVMSAAARARISSAARKRWAGVRAQARKVAAD